MRLAAIAFSLLGGALLAALAQSHESGATPMVVLISIDGLKPESVVDADHQLALVSLVTGRARQALPGVAKRVLNEWTSTLVAANNDRRTRQRAAERRVDIAGSSGTGSDGSRSMAPRDIDYRRMSDSDILNL